MIVDASLIRRAKPEAIARLARSLGVSVAGLDHEKAVARVAKAVMKSTVEGMRERAREERAQREEFSRTAQRQWDALITEQIG